MHDREKESYDRIYHSATTSEEFTNVFREFCAVTYRDGVHEFDQVTFEGYFRNLTSIEKLDNKKIMTKDNFIHDACATACMMYEADLKILYIDPGFQEYLFAEYNYLEDPEVTIEFGKKLWSIPLEAFEDDSAFSMFCEFSMDKVEMTYFMPFLSEIFKGKSEKDAFIAFLKNGYRKIDYQVENPALIAEYTRKEKAEWQPLKPAVAEPANIVFSMILKQAEVEGSLSLSAAENALNYPDFMTASIYGRDHYDGNEKKKTIIATRVFQTGSEKKLDLEQYASDNFVMDDSAKPVCFGHEYEADFNIIGGSPEDYKPLLETLGNREKNVWKGFCRIKAYYEELKYKHADMAL